MIPYFVGLFLGLLAALICAGRLGWIVGSRENPVDTPLWVMGLGVAGCVCGIALERLLK